MVSVAQETIPFHFLELFEIGYGEVKVGFFGIVVILILQYCQTSSTLLDEIENL